MTAVADAARDAPATVVAGLPELPAQSRYPWDVAGSTATSGLTPQRDVAKALGRQLPLQCRSPRPRSVDGRLEQSRLLRSRQRASPSKLYIQLVAKDWTPPPATPPPATS